MCAMTAIDQAVAQSRPRSKLVATWLAVIGGALGAHRFYLRGKADPWAWLHVLATLVGAAGVVRMRQLGQDDQLAWVLAPVLGLVISAAMLAALIMGLMSDEKWAGQFRPAQAVRPSGWGVILAVISALLLGSTALMSTLAFSGQRFFEYLAQQPPA